MAKDIEADTGEGSVDHILIGLPSIKDQLLHIHRESNERAVKQLEENLRAPFFHRPDDFDKSVFSFKHLRREDEGWERPAPQVITSYFRHFQKVAPEYGTDKKLAKLLGLSSDRRVREYKEGQRNIPYAVWRRFLVVTGQVPQDVLPVIVMIA